MPSEPAAVLGSFLVDRRAAMQAVEAASSILEATARDERVNQSGVVHVVIMDPALPPGACAFEDAILHEHTAGKPRTQWDADYAGFARAKARLSWQYGCDTHALQLLQPHRLRTGDSALWGSVALEGIVVAVSGCEAPYDEALSGIVAMLLRAQAKTAAAKGYAAKPQVG